MAAFRSCISSIGSRRNGSSLRSKSRSSAACFATARVIICSKGRPEVQKGKALSRLFTRSGSSERRCAAKASFEPNGVGKVTFNKAESSDATGVFGKLRQLGLPALISYGLLNTLYYVCAFIIAYWSYSAAVSSAAPTPAGLKGQFGQALIVLSVVWAGSQVTKVFRASGALLLTPQVEMLLSYLERKLRLGSQVQAAVLVTLLCFLLASFVLTSSVLIKATLV
jgi:hypothetical protein